MTKDEEILQSECFKWFWNEPSLRNERMMLFHVDNNSWNAIIGAKKKGLGVVAGISDFVLILDCEVDWIELKTLNGTQTPEQKEFEAKVKERGHKYVIIRTVEQFIHYTLKRLNGKR